MLNINGSTDPSYRYKMPRVVGKVEGRGNGIKTVIVNCADVSRSLKRPAEQLTKFIGLQMGASSRIEHDKSIVNGAIETGELQKLVTLYIEKFVLCPKCGNPETVQQLAPGGSKKSQVVVLKCKACGETTDADNSHRLTTQIVKELLDAQASNGSAAVVSSSKEDKKKSSNLAGLKNNADAQNEATAAADDEKKKKKKDSKKKDSKKKSKKDAADEAPLDLEAFKSALDALVSKLDATEDVDENEDAIIEHASGLCDEFSLSSKRDFIPLIWAACVSSRTQRVGASIEKYRAVLAAAVRKSSKNASKLLSSAASYAGEDEKMIKTIPLALKALFDTEVCSDEDILTWFEKAKLTPRVKAQLQVLMDWLEADEESSSEEESGSGSEEEEDAAPKRRRNSSASNSSSDNSSSGQE